MFRADFRKSLLAHFIHAGVFVGDSAFPGTGGGRLLLLSGDLDFEDLEDGVLDFSLEGLLDLSLLEMLDLLVFARHIKKIEEN